MARCGFTLIELLVVVGITAHAAEMPTLKAAYEDYFYVGVAINRPIAMGNEARADNVNRTREEVQQDTATVVAQFNQIAPENDLKWQLIHPRRCPMTRR